VEDYNITFLNNLAYKSFLIFIYRKKYFSK